MAIVYTRRHITHDKKIRCPLCGKTSDCMKRLM